MGAAGGARRAEARVQPLQVTAERGAGTEAGGGLRRRLQRPLPGRRLLRLRPGERCLWRRRAWVGW